MSVTKTAAQISVGIAFSIVASAIGVAVFINSGVYDIGADDHDTKLVTAMIETLRERSISMRANSIDVPGLEDPAKIVAGASRYATLCVGCHLAPGVAKSALRAGLYPQAPNLAQEDLYVQSGDPLHGRPIRCHRSLNRPSARSESKVGRNKIDGLNRAS